MNHVSFSEPPSVLNSTQLYRQDVSHCPRLCDEQQEHILVDRACRGDVAARNQLIEGCLQSVSYYAGRYAQLYHLDYLDLVDVGNFALVDQFEKALSKDHFCIYLMALARYEMQHYGLCGQYTVKRGKNQDGSYAPAYTMLPLDTTFAEMDDGTGKENSSTLVDILPQPEPRRGEEKDYGGLHGCIPQQGSAKKWDYVIFRYGLFDQPPMTTTAIAKAYHASESNVAAHLKDALAMLHTRLAPLYPQYENAMSDEVRNAQAREERHRAKVRKEHKSTLTCPICQQTVEGCFTRAQKYCSSECSKRAQVQVRSGKKTVLTCALCQTTVQGEFRSTRQFCSNRCWKAARKQKLAA